MLSDPGRKRIGHRIEKKRYADRGNEHCEFVLTQRTIGEALDRYDERTDTHGGEQHDNDAGGGERPWKCGMMRGVR